MSVAWSTSVAFFHGVIAASMLCLYNICYPGPGDITNPEVSLWACGGLFMVSLQCLILQASDLSKYTVREERIIFTITTSNSRNVSPLRVDGDVERQEPQQDNQEVLKEAVDPGTFTNPPETQKVMNSLVSRLLTIPLSPISGQIHHKTQVHVPPHLSVVFGRHHCNPVHRLGHPSPS
jgi:hypothetical protein